jgi:hypothetical protein
MASTFFYVEVSDHRETAVCLVLRSGLMANAKQEVALDTHFVARE